MLEHYLTIVPENQKVLIDLQNCYLKFLNGSFRSSNKVRKPQGSFDEINKTRGFSKKAVRFLVENVARIEQHRTIHSIVARIITITIFDIV